MPAPDAGVQRDAAFAPDAAVISDAGVLPDAGEPDPTAPYFEPSHLLEVEIELGAADWDLLRAESREFPGLLIGEGCLDEPFYSPYTYFPAKVTVDGETLEQVGVKKKGFLGSLSEVRPSLKLKFDELVPGQRLGGMERLTLNNARQDASFLRTCIAYETFQRAGVPAPRCNFAHLVVNGEDMGVYVHVEAMEKPFLRRHFDDDEGLLYEGTLSDFRDGWTGTFEKKTNEEAPDDRSALLRVVAALELPEAELEDALEEVLDVDAFLTFWATEVLLAHWDGYSGNTNNFYVYQEPLSERFYFMPWGPDAVLSPSPFLPEGTPNSVLATGLLTRRLYEHPQIRARYLERLSALLTDAWSEAEVSRYIDQAVPLIGPRVLQPQIFNNAVGELRQAVAARRAAIAPELLAGGVDWTTPLRGSPCWTEVGSVLGELRTTWGTHPAQNPFDTDTGTVAVTFQGNAFSGVTVGGSAGYGVNPDDQGQAVFILPAFLADNAIVAVYVATAPELVRPGSSIEIDFGQTRAAILYAPRPGAELQVVGWLGNGRIQVIDGGLTNGAPVHVTIDAAILGQGSL